MACFVVPVTEAVVTTIAAKTMASREKKAAPAGGARIPFSRKLQWLNKLLWGGSGLLAFEHIWHGEVVPWFPFLTAASEPAAAAEMLHEMATTGTAMAALVTAVWLGILAVVSAMERQEAARPAVAEGAE